MYTLNGITLDSVSWSYAGLSERLDNPAFLKKATEQKISSVFGCYSWRVTNIYVMEFTIWDVFLSLIVLDYASMHGILQRDIIRCLFICFGVLLGLKTPDFCNVGVYSECSNCCRKDISPGAASRRSAFLAPPRLTMLWMWPIFWTKALPR